MISFLDHGLGRLTSTIQDLGLDNNTVIVFTTDHGELLGDHGLMLKGPTLYEGLVKIGLIVVAPDSLKDEKIYDPVSTIDLAATFYDYAGIRCPEGILQSTSLRSLVSGTSEEKRACAYCEWKAGEERYGVDLDLRMVRTSRYKAIFELNSNCGELYDLEEDPQEMSNLYDDPGYSLVRKIVEKCGLQWSDEAPFENKNLGDALLTPTKLYVKQCLELKNIEGVKAFAHITGGGLTENILRALGEGQGIKIDLSTWNLPPVFKWLSSAGGVSQDEMLKTFNCGIGMSVICSQASRDAVFSLLEKNGESPTLIGEVKIGRAHV